MSPLTLTTSQFQIKTAKLMATFFPKPICHFHTKPPIKKGLATLGKSYIDKW